MIENPARYGLRADYRPYMLSDGSRQALGVLYIDSVVA
jgi:hypothetical protein